MQLLRMFSKEKYKGTKYYIRTQKRYEILRTVIYFAISLSLFIAGYVATKSRMNLLTVVAVLGCLPACKSAVDMIMFLRYQGCSLENVEKIEASSHGLSVLFDMVFTSYSRNYEIAHMVVKGNTVCGFTEEKEFKEQDFNKHITDILKVDGYKEVSVKVFSDKNKYLERLKQLQELDTDETYTQGIINTLKSVSL